MDSLKPYVQLKILTEKKGAGAFFISFLLLCSTETLSHLLSQNTKQIIVLAIANDLWGLENHHGI